MKDFHNDVIHHINNVGVFSVGELYQHFNAGIVSEKANCIRNIIKKSLNRKCLQRIKIGKYIVVNPIVMFRDNYDFTLHKRYVKSSEINILYFSVKDKLNKVNRNINVLCTDIDSAKERLNNIIGKDYEITLIKKQ